MDPRLREFFRQGTAEVGSNSRNNIYQTWGLILSPHLYRGTIPNGKNLPLTQFRHLRQLLGRSCSYLLPRQDGGISQNYVSGRFLPFGMVPLYWARNYFLLWVA